MRTELFMHFYIINLALWERERAGPCVSRAFFILHALMLSFFSSSWCQGLPAACVVPDFFVNILE